MYETENGTEWSSLRKKIHMRDKHCRLVEVLSAREFYILKRNAGQLIGRCDPAHVLARSRAPHMKMNEDNIVWLNRYSHEMLDTCKSPISGECITREERDLWWKRIVGEEMYTKLIGELDHD
jgi:hypothetical protein